MNSLSDPQKIQAFYDNYFELTGETNGWPSTQAALTIYHEGSNSPYQVWEQFKDVLDVGSGEGHFAAYLRDIRKFTGDYIGIEILPMFYEQSIMRYGDHTNAKFILADFLRHEFGAEKFDWITSLGSLSVRQSRQHDHDLAVCHKIHKLARFGFSIYINDPQHTPADIKKHTPQLAYHDPISFLTLLKNEFRIQNAQAVSFSTGGDTRGTMIHAQIQGK
jgi:SAM-dependent methyltransferase